MDIGGIYYFQLIDHYAASISVMYLTLFEVIAIAWFYGAWRLSKKRKINDGTTTWSVYQDLLDYSYTKLTIMNLLLITTVYIIIPDGHSHRVDYSSIADILCSILYDLGVFAELQERR
ncbi:hypothetical protein NQ317_010887 [Molorchus minor]|uniref:Uncharacterized protein n=1 Tax=Molorchus minor TaxID=1323400 RepID=A0ABQ9JEW4_9CUCU|nr:hypothetical protein NQ317_010887 [Molorchus minor]